jgi:protein involved in polysaccharide export with SLBB domain
VKRNLLFVLMTLCHVGACAAELAPAVISEVISTASPRNIPSDYRIYVGDRLSVQVFDQPDLSIELLVPMDGYLSFPLIGEVQSPIGWTLSELRWELKKRLERDFLKLAVVTISIKEFGARQAFVMGQVTKPGTVDLDPFHPVSALQAIGQAGGLKEEANPSGAFILRDDPLRPGMKLSLAVASTIAAAKDGGDIVLSAGDVIVVPRLDRIYVVGQVNKSGALDISSSERMTVSKAISLAGGFTRFSSESGVVLVRSNQAAQVIDVHAIFGGSSTAEDPPLKPGDTVYVPASRF